MSAILKSFYQYLLSLYLFCSLLIAAASWVWQRQDEQQRLQLQLQQYAQIIELSLRPNLGQISAEQLTQRLAELQFDATFPIAALAIYQNDGLPLAVVGDIARLPQRVLPNLNSQFSLLADEYYWYAQQIIRTQTLPFEQFGTATQTEAVLVILPEPLGIGWRELWPMVLAWLLLTVIVLTNAVFFNRRGHQLRQAIDSLQREHDQADIGASVAKSGLPELQPIKQLLAEQHQQRVSLEQQLDSTRMQQQQLTKALENTRQEWQNTVTAQLSLRQCVNRWLHQWQLLDLRREQLPEPLFNVLKQLQHNYGLLQFGDFQCTPVVTSLPMWLAEQTDKLAALLPADSSLDWLEYPELNQYQVTLDQHSLLLAMQAMLALSMRSETMKRLQFRIGIDLPDSPRLSMQLRCDGNGLPPHVLQHLKSSHSSELQWRDADIAVLQLLQQRQGAELRIESLEGLGVSISFSLPIACHTNADASLLGPLLLFDADPERLRERLHLLSSCTVQIIGCSDLNELQQRLAEQAYSLLIIMLPGQAPSQQWQQFLQHCTLPMLAFAAPLNFRQWRQLLPCYSSSLFCLQFIKQRLSGVMSPSSKKLLVVDDNQTNQAFINILLQGKAVTVCAVETAAAALWQCKQEKFDMVLLDIQLPDLSGTEVARQLRQLEDYQSIPILAFTAHALPSEQAEFKAAGMDDILLKPLDPCKFDKLLATYRLF